MEAAGDPLRSQQIATVDAASGLLAVGADADDRKVYRCTSETVVLLNDRPVKLSDLAPGMVVVVTATKPGLAARVAAIEVKSREKKLHQVSVERTVVVSSANTAQRAMILGPVYAGQIVRIALRGPIRWTCGGKRAGEFCGWGGFPDDRYLGMPRMALVAFVDKAPFLASGERFTFTVPADGKLGLFANDDDPAGNEGSAEVVVTVAWY